MAEILTLQPRPPGDILEMRGKVFGITEKILGITGKILGTKLGNFSGCLGNFSRDSCEISRIEDEMRSYRETINHFVQPGPSRNHYYTTYRFAENTDDADHHVANQNDVTRSHSVGFPSAKAHLSAPCTHHRLSPKRKEPSIYSTYSHSNDAYIIEQGGSSR